MAPPLPITVLGGYLGAGKTTLLNSLLARAGGRRIGVVVNDFGELGIDAELLADTGADGLISLPNGCVCCTLGADLHDALAVLASQRPSLDHLVIEASGVADPSVAAAWGTSAGFAPGGVIVLVAADDVLRLARDRYVGGEVRRQIEGADLLVITKTDLCDSATVARVEAWLDGASSAPRLRASAGDVPVDVIVGVAGDLERGRPVAGPIEVGGHVDDRYVTRSEESEGPIDPTWLTALEGRVPEGLLRLKAVGVLPGEDAHIVVQVVGGTVSVERIAGTRSRSLVVAIGRRDRWDPGSLRPWP